MVDPVTARIWAFRALFVGLVALLALGRLMPLGGPPGGLPGPDLIVALTLAWVVRRPAYVPAWLIVALFLPLDLLLGNPPGLGALVAFAGAEALRARQSLTRTLPFPLEWALVTAVLLAMTGAAQIVLALFIAPRPPLGLDLLRALFTALAYPLVVFVSQTAFGVRKASPGEVDALGARL